MKKLFLPCFIIVLIATVLAFCLSVNTGGYIDRNNDWIGYVGSIAGGILTIYGVAWTLHEQNEQFIKSLNVQKKLAEDELNESKRQFELELEQKNKELELIKSQRKEDLAIQYRPILQVQKKKIRFINSSYIHSDIEDVDEYGNPSKIREITVPDQHFRINIILKNIGRGEISKGVITCKTKDKYISSNHSQEFNDIFPNDRLNISFRINLDNYKNFIYEYYDNTIIIKIEYYDFINTKTFVEIPININNIAALPTYDEESDNIVYTDNQLFCSIGNIIRYSLVNKNQKEE